MKWDFFYDEGQGQPYDSIYDLYKEIKHLIIPRIVMVVLGTGVYLYLRFFPF